MSAQARFPSQASVIVIGGGIAGCSIAYHLAAMGRRDVVLLEKGELTSGSTWHAAGMVTHFHTSPTLMRMRKYSIEMYRRMGEGINGQWANEQWTGEGSRKEVAGGEKAESSRQKAVGEGEGSRKQGAGEEQSRQKAEGSKQKAEDRRQAEEGAGHWHEVGSLRVASSRDQLLFLQRQVGMAKAIGLEVEVIGADTALEIFPWMTGESLYGAIYLPTDGWIDPSGATMEIARRARALGAGIWTDVRVTDIQCDARGAVCGVVTDRGTIATECVVNAAGMWGRQVGEMVRTRDGERVNLPMTPLGHQHLLVRMPDYVFPKNLPCLRDPENLIYLREEVGGLVIGGFELEPREWAMDGVPWDFTSKLLSPDWELFAPIMEGAVRRMPMLEHADAQHLVHGPEAITPDSKPLLGPVPGVPGFWAACGLSHTGFGAGAAIGEILAEWIVDGEPPYDVTELNVRRFGELYRDRAYASERAKEAYKYYYWLRFPHDENERARAKRLSPLDAKLMALGGVFADKNGWERVSYFERGKPGRRAGADQRATGWFRTAFWEQVGAEHRAARERAALWDMTSFGKLEVRGKDALAFLNALADNELDKPVGSLVYTQFLNADGGIESDVTIARLDEDAFRVICGSNFVASDLGWMKMALGGEPREVSIRDVTEEYAVLGLWGPRARQILERVTRDDVSNAGFPYMTGKRLSISAPASVEVWAQRVTYVGELGWELYMRPADAGAVWDALMAAGAEHDIMPAGYKALESLRLEKGYRYWSSDITPSENPYEAGLGFCVKLSKGDFVGRAALARVKAEGVTRKLATITLAPNMGLYGGEPVYHNGELLGRLRSGGYGYTVGKSIGFVYVPSELAKAGTPLEIELFGERFAAQVDADMLYDPRGERVRM